VLPVVRFSWTWTPDTEGTWPPGRSCRYGSHPPEFRRRAVELARERTGPIDVSAKETPRSAARCRARLSSIPADGNLPRCGSHAVRRVEVDDRAPRGQSTDSTAPRRVADRAGELVRPIGLYPPGSSATGLARKPARPRGTGFELEDYCRAILG
jgi:hypothetical protein